MIVIATSINFESDVEDHINVDELSELSDTFGDDSSVSDLASEVSLNIKDISFNRDLDKVNVPARREVIRRRPLAEVGRTDKHWGGVKETPTLLVKQQHLQQLEFPDIEGQDIREFEPTRRDKPERSRSQKGRRDTHQRDSHQPPTEEVHKQPPQSSRRREITSHNPKQQQNKQHSVVSSVKPRQHPKHAQNSDDTGDVSEYCSPIQFGDYTVPRKPRGNRLPRGNIPTNYYYDESGCLSSPYPNVGYYPFGGHVGDKQSEWCPTDGAVPNTIFAPLKRTSKPVVRRPDHNEITSPVMDSCVIKPLSVDGLNPQAREFIPTFLNL
jgi:hypothetical protein